MAQSITHADALRLARPAGGPDAIIAPQLALPEGLRAQAAMQALAEIDLAALALPARAPRIFATVWSWRLFPFVAKDRSEDPGLYFCGSLSLGGSLGDCDGDFDAQAFMHAHIPSLTSPIIARSFLLALWSEDGLRSQHLDSWSAQDSRHSGDFSIERGTDWTAHFRRTKASRAVSLLERAALDSAAASGRGSGRAATRL